MVEKLFQYPLELPTGTLSRNGILSIMAYMLHIPDVRVTLSDSDSEFGALRSRVFRVLGFADTFFQSGPSIRV